MPDNREAKEWLNAFLFCRGLFKGATGEPLYSYQVERDEFEALKQLLRNVGLNKHPPRGLPHYNGAAFCLFVAEYYRRQYNHNWSWDGAEELIGHNLTPQCTSKLTEQGLSFWKREPLSNGDSVSYLGSLFAEGGSPWSLINSEQHGFGRSVRRGIAQYYKLNSLGKSLTSLMLEHQHELPKNFRNIRTAKLLSGIVESLIALIENHPLKALEDPAAYLDEHAKGWNKKFPIPLDISNGRRLINDWLRQAEKEREHYVATKKRAEESLSEFTAEHYAALSNEGIQVESEVILPNFVSLSTRDMKLTSTRFEPLIYEGDKLIYRCPVVYGSIDSAQERILLSFKQSRLLFAREDVGCPLTFKLVSFGTVIFSRYIENSDLDFENYPQVLIEESDKWAIVGSESYSVKESTARVWVPRSCHFSLGEEEATKIVDNTNGALFEIRTDIVLKDRSGHVYEISLGAEDLKKQMRLVGHETLWSTLPTTTYYDFPKLKIEDNSSLNVDELRYFLNGNEISNPSPVGVFGKVKFVVADRNGKAILRRTFGVVPHDFKVNTKPSLAGQPAELKIISNMRCQSYPRITGNSQVASIDEHRYRLTVTEKSEPETLFIDVASENVVDPVTIRLPFPVAGARLISPEGKVTSERTILLSNLLGYRIYLTNDSEQRQHFTICLKVQVRGSVVYQTYDDVYVNDVPIEVSLFGLHREITRLLGNVGDQDAAIQLTVETSQAELLRLLIQRYDTYLVYERGELATKSYLSEYVALNTPLHAINIVDPAQSISPIHPICSAGTSTGRYDISDFVDSADTWIFYSGDNVELRIRPFVFNGEALVTGTINEGEITSLHQACKLYHPVDRPQTIRTQIEAMSFNYSHSGWDYLGILKDKYSHLPLSSFEAWRALSRDSNALALAVFRLELDMSFCERIRDELAVVWEFVPINKWRQAREIFSQSLGKLGIPQSYIDLTIREREEALKDLVFAFEYLNAYLVSGDSNDIRDLPLDYLLETWYQELRRFNYDNQNWPTDLTTELLDFINESDLAPSHRQISRVGFTHAVTYLPIFLAHITAGQLEPASLAVEVSDLKFAISKLSDFSREIWFKPAHAAVTAHLLANSQKE